MAGLLLVAGLAYGECSLNPDELGASYRVSQAHAVAGGEEDGIQATEVRLWRHQGQVAEEFPALQLMETWIQDDVGIRPKRYLDAYHTVVEYLPLSSSGDDLEAHWIEKYQLIATDLLASMALQGRRFDGCEQVEIYRFQSGSRQVYLEWMPALRLVNVMRDSYGEVMTEWRLQQDYVTDSQLIDQVFAARQRYTTVSSTHVRGVSTDPGLLKMVDMGFLHSATGFYDSKGSLIEAGIQQ